MSTDLDLLLKGAAGIVAFVFVAGVMSGLLKHRASERQARRERAKFLDAIPAVAKMMAGLPGSTMAPHDWTVVLKQFYDSGFSLDEMNQAVRIFAGVLMRTDRVRPGRRFKPGTLGDVLTREDRETT